MSIQEHLNKIRNAIYGREVRESIAKGIETAYDDASENGNANMEVKIARGTHPNLRSRLEEVDNKQKQTVSQLAQVDSKQQQTTAQLAQVDSKQQQTTAQLAQKAEQSFAKDIENRLNNVIAGLDGTEEFYTPIGLEQYMTTQGQEWNI